MFLLTPLLLSSFTRDFNLCLVNHIQLQDMSVFQLSFRFWWSDEITKPNAKTNNHLNLNWNKTQYFRLRLFWLLFWCSECYLIALWLLSECSLSAQWVLTECSLSADLFVTDCLKIWARMMKIDCSRQTWTARTNERTLALLGLLSEPKKSSVLFVAQRHFCIICTVHCSGWWWGAEFNNAYYNEGLGWIKIVKNPLNLLICLFAISTGY